MMTPPRPARLRGERPRPAPRRRGTRGCSERSCSSSRHAALPPSLAAVLAAFPPSLRCLPPSLPRCVACRLPSLAALLASFPPSLRCLPPSLPRCVACLLPSLAALLASLLVALQSPALERCVTFLAPSLSVALSLRRSPFMQAERAETMRVVTSLLAQLSPDAVPFGNDQLLAREPPAVRPGVCTVQRSRPRPTARNCLVLIASRAHRAGCTCGCGDEVPVRSG
jgi:hypothetical protein